MKKVFFFTLLFVLIISLVSASEELKMVCGPKNSDMWKLSNHIGSALTEVKISSKGGGPDVQLISSSGPYESIKMLFSHDSNLAIVDALSAYEATSGVGRFSKLLRRDVLALAVLGLEVEHFVLVSAKSEKNNVLDMTEKMIYLGRKGDYRRYGAYVSLKSLGVENFHEGGNEWDYETSAELMIDGSIDGAVYFGIPPVKAVQDIKKVMGSSLVILSVDDSAVSELRGSSPIWFSHTIAANKYPKQKEPVVTVAKPILLVSTRSLNKKTAKALLSDLFDAKSMEYLNSVNLPIDAQMSQRYKVIEYHPGAVEFFKSGGD
ncbi:MAG: TAXI family TRAP transporter solute-binding subunit [Deltaproteobacteria bacterium]|uniref:TAXI family TRAP transporter solute-binding subunit n=1 Tax=Candidatus Zymogenus saltonus TaxID=2844893 RepID=A0A9D8PN84_9DELT|nr:TAXI family TRAP transporter solute-binding subunit [Candidatus Zymogenus saltonus]